MRLTTRTTHTGWDNSIEPVAHVAGGDTVTVEVANSSGGQVTRSSTAPDLASLDFARVNPVTGPIAVDGAEPGDTLVVDVLDIDVDSWGWTANIPGFGLLADQFPDPHLLLCTISGGRAEFRSGIRIPVVPMIGTIGMAPPEPGRHPMVPPHRHGGNMDIRQLTAGTRLRLPVGVPGALLSLGDTHAAQGDGEVCGTGIEISSTVTVRVAVEKDRPVAFPVLETHPRSNRSGPALVTTGVGPDLLVAARDAVRSLIDEVVRRTGMAPVEAYLLASAAADLHVSEIVDLPNVVVSMHLSRAVLDGR